MLTYKNNKSQKYKTITLTASVMYYTNEFPSNYTSTSFLLLIEILAKIKKMFSNI